MSVRTSSKVASKIEPGDRLMIMGIRVAVVQSVSPIPEHGVLRWIDRGVGNPQEPVYWTEVCLQWEDHPGSPDFFVVVEGTRQVSLRDTNPDHPTTGQRQ